VSIDIYYFSGTGNSLYVARELKNLLPDVELIPIVGAIKSKNFVTKAKNVGFIFPCHGLTIPIPVRNFLKKINVVSSDYFFAIVTRGGTVFRGFHIIDNCLKKQGKSLNAAFTINMALNDPKLEYFTVPTKDELDVLEINAIRKLKLVKRVILSKYSYNGDNKSGVTFSNNIFLNYILERLVPFMTHFISPLIKKYFYADSKCTSCGICEKVCPAGKIKMDVNRPVWQQDIDCYLCYACLNYCPVEAVQIYSKIWMKSYTKEKGRYPHPYATVEDILKQKGV
jgi:ferredoxin